MALSNDFPCGKIGTVPESFFGRPSGQAKATSFDEIFATIGRTSLWKSA